MLVKRVLLAALSLGFLVVLAQASPAAARGIGPVKAQLTSLSAAAVEELAAPQPDCCPKPCVTYRHRGPKLCCDCKPGVPTVLKVKDPCSCCETEISVCLPACCTGEPTMSCGSGLFCRDVVCYEWCCGFSVRVTFKHCGDLIVTTWGR
jgi:hypothetical protein